MKAPTIIEAMADPDLFLPHFRDPASWTAWRVFVSVLFGLPLDHGQWRIFRKATGRETIPTQQAREAWLVCGRRSGKSFILALCAVYLAAFRDWTPFLAIGERAVLMLVAADRRQAQILLRYIRALLKQTPLLVSLIEREGADAIDLSNKVTIEIITSSYKTSRGRAVCAALLDELAFWPTDESAAEPDSEVVAAIRPSMAQFGEQAVLLAASSPYARKGELYQAHRQHWGKDGDPILVWRADTRFMNPSIPQQFITEAYARDPASAAAEYGAEFRSDIESFVSREVVEACIHSGMYERPPQANMRYVAFVDPSGGSADSFTLAIAHRADEQVLLDAVREVRPPFSPESVSFEFSRLCKTYRISKVTGDRYAGEWPREQFRKHGIGYEVSQSAKSDLYRDLLPLLNSQLVRLLDHSRLVLQLIGLERRTARSGRDSIDHASGGHDDLANCVAGALLSANSVCRKRIRIGVIRGAGACGPVTWDDPEPVGRRIRCVRIPEASAPASRGP
jgi:hypothetical protein